jgi:hypothetical protein
MDRAGFRMSLEIHLDALSRDQPERLTLATLSGPTITFRRGSGREGMALGHVDMLRHLTRHAFEPARRIRLIHLYDIWRYQAVFAGEIDREQLASRFPGVCVVLGLVASVFSPRGGALDPCNDQSRPTPAGVGCGMVPLSEILAGDDGLGAKLNALFDPPAWWLHGFYRVPAGRSLLACRTIRHPANVARWLTRRLAAGVGSLAAAEARPSGTTAPCSPSGASLTTR